MTAKKTAILGLNSAGFNTSSALLLDGTPIFAVEEERMVREKRTRRFPNAGIRHGLKLAGLDIGDLDGIAIGWNPAINLEAFGAAYSGRARFLGEIFYNVPGGLMQLAKRPAAERAEQIIHLDGGKKLHIHYIRHHVAHASSFFVSPFDEAAVLTLDAFGEKECVHFAHGKGNKLDSLWSQEFPHSLGSFYSAFTAYLGFAAQSDEWKLMGASAFGNAARYIDRVRSLIQFKDDGFELDLSCFNHYQFHRPGLYTAKMEQVLGIAPATDGDNLGQDHYDLAAAAQAVFEEIYIHLLTRLHARTGCRNVVLSGGSTLNSLANGKVVARTPFEDVFIPPAPDDAGCAMGAASYLYHHVMGNPRSYVMRHNYLGPSYGDAEISDLLTGLAIKHTELPDPSRTAAEMVAAGKVIGWFQGGLEFGDRALGNRSILADPRDPSMKDRVNALVKYREGFRPFAPAILAEKVDEYFEGAAPTPFMEKVFPIREAKRAILPAVTHADGTGRLQTVTAEQNPLFHRLITAFGEITGVPVVMNTSFNVKGEPMVCSPQDAVRTFFSSGLDALVIGRYLITK